MRSRHTGRRRRGAAVAVVLAVTLGAGALARAPVGAAEGGGTTASEPGGRLPMVPGARLAAAGPKGFLTWNTHASDTEGKLRWTPYAGGPTRDIVYDTIEGVDDPSGDMVATSSEVQRTRWVDMSTGASYAVRPVDDGMDLFYAGTAGRAIFTRGNTKLWMQTENGEPRPVQGLADDVWYARVRAGDATHGLLATGEITTPRTALIDLTDATLTYPYPSGARNPTVAGNRIAWVEDDPATHAPRAVVRDLTTGADTAVPLPGVTAGASQDIGLLGGWLVNGTWAVRIGTGERIALLDRSDALAAVPDGSALLVQGRGPTQGDGIFRVTLTADGRPTVRLLAHAGTPTTALHDFDLDGLPDLLGRDSAGVLWRDSAGDGRPRARVGPGWQIYDKIEAAGDIAEPWNHLPDLVARDKAGVLWLYSGQEKGGFTPRVRVGPGWQTYSHLTGGSDLNGDGRPDLVAADTSGTLWLYRGTGETARPYERRTRIGGGRQVYSQLAAVGDLAGGPAGDLVARDRSGVLWLYLGRGDGTFAPRTRIGGGWQVYSQLVGAGDVDHDGKADLFGYLPGTRTVYLYAGTGDATRPFEPRTVSDAQTGNAYTNMS
ncbi:FG-GAP repeat domain-containing protein [Actinacidiphila alni]|uniref:FG-GAP repeat domain-containing protein n=1 Tax=Actinacidiphila alni TaxID=380248 RepID=UPI003451D427